MSSRSRKDPERAGARGRGGPGLAYRKLRVAAGTVTAAAFSCWRAEAREVAKVR